jgi:hypothetical protein
MKAREIRLVVGAALFAHACHCGSIINEQPPTSGSTPCDSRGQCPGTLICDQSSMECIQGGTPSVDDPPMDCTTSDPEQQTIVLGTGLQCILIGQSTFADVVALLGPADLPVVRGDGGVLLEADGGSDGGSYVQVYDGGAFIDYEADGLDFYNNDCSPPGLDNAVSDIFVSSPFAGKTVEGVALGMSMDQVHSLLGKPKCTATGVSGMDDYACNGGWLWYDANNNLRQIQIFTPFQEDYLCTPAVACSQQ